MPTLAEVIEDLNVSIVDMETLKPDTPVHLQLHLIRAIGQLKAARGCLLVIAREEVKK